MVLVLWIVAVRCAIDTDGNKVSQLACEQSLSVQRLFKKHFIEIPQQRTLYITSKIIITVTQRLDPTRCQLLAKIYANAEIRLRSLQWSYCF